MSDFEQRLQKAIFRGRDRNEAREREARAQELDEEELKRLHSQHRLRLSEQIENCVGRLPNHLPGFQFKTIYGEKGWGAACSRDDIGSGVDGKRTNLFSQLEMAIRPFSSLHVLELTAKGTVRNRELFNRKHFEKIIDADVENFAELIDLWVLEYAELYAASG